MVAGAGYNRARERCLCVPGRVKGVDRSSDDFRENRDGSEKY